MTFIFVFLFTAVVIVVGTLLLGRMAKLRAIESARLDESIVTASDVDDAIRHDIAPAARPYGQGAVFATGDGEMYAAAVDGSVRRFAVAETATGEKEVVLLKRPGKAARKAAKRAKRADRGIGLAPVTQAARTADRDSAKKLAQQLASANA